MMIVLLWILILALLGGCGGDSSSGGETGFTDPAGYSLEVPEGWMVSDETAGDGLIRADFSRDEEMGIQVRLSSMPAAGFSSTVRSALDDYRRDMTGHWGGSLTETERITPDAGDEALTVRFRFSRDDGSEWYLQYSLVRKDDRLLMFQGGCSWPDREEGMQAFDNVVESVRFQ
ncbi:hypothetical protein GF402_11320 [Candidatus Fermentibacteria bacterium]|nr:hypothetical protein [Candidatus Fermentibacteria bacterium]